MHYIYHHNNSPVSPTLYMSIVILHSTLLKNAATGESDRPLPSPSDNNPPVQHMTVDIDSNEIYGRFLEIGRAGVPYFFNI